MKRIVALEIKTDGYLKVKRQTLVITSCAASSNLEGKIKDEEQTSYHSVTVWRLMTWRMTLNRMKHQKPQNMPNASNMIQQMVDP